MPRRLHDVAVTLSCLAVAAGGCKEGPKASGFPEDSAPPVASSAASAVEAPGTSAESPAGTAAKPSTQHASPGSTMKLLESGQEPRRKLRYAWRLDQKERLAMDLRTTASTGAAGTNEVPLPSVHIAMDIDPKSVGTDGDLRYAWRVTSAKTDARDETPSDVTEGMRVEVAGIARLSGTAVVTSRGLTKEVTVDPGSAVDAVAASQMAEQVIQTLRDVAAPLPDEEVGVGARWRKLSQLDERDARVTQTETFRLADLQGDKGALADTLAQTAPPQALRAPAASPGARARMESMLASGNAKVRFDLSRLVPQTTFDGTTTMVLSGDTARTTKMVMRVFIAIAGSRQ
jgi:hypothetical protein